MATPIAIALVGCGRIAQRHADLLGAHHIAGAKLVGVADVMPQRARTLADRHGIPWFADMHEMVKQMNPDVIAVLTESGNHAKHVVELAQHRRHLIVEKPMALTTHDADRMIDACDAAGVKLFVVKQNRLNVPVVHLRQALERQRFGKLILGTVRVRWCRDQRYYDQDGWRGTWAMDGGVLANQASHHIDLLQWMMGDVESVFARGTTALVDIEAEDTAVVVVKFRNGALGIIEATTATRPTDLEGSISILGERGVVEIGGFAVNEMRVWRFTDSDADDAEVVGKYSVNPPNVYGFGHQSFYEQVVSCLTDGSGRLVNGSDGKKSLELIQAIYESMETGREVILPLEASRSRLGRS